MGPLILTGGIIAAAHGLHKKLAPKNTQNSTPVQAKVITSKEAQRAQNASLLAA